MLKKQCTKCKEWKNLDCFGKCKSNKDGLQYNCKQCQNKYRNENKDKIRERNKEYNILNREKRKEYNILNKERRKEYNILNKERISKNNKKWIEENKERREEYLNKIKKDFKKYQKLYNKSPIQFNSKSKYKKEIKLYEEVRESKEGYLECKCAYCGDWFTPTYLNIKSRIQSINKENLGEQRLYCSEPCKQSCPTYGQKLYPKGFKEATSREVQPELRQMVLARDNYTCQRCGKFKDELIEHGIALHCHHLEGIHWEPLESADMDQCITYCQPCHVKAHQQPDCSYHDQQCK